MTITFTATPERHPWATLLELDDDRCFERRERRARRAAARAARRHPPTAPGTVDAP
jgi:hypothetical protein